jgi:EAL domain-containing protein (putative c-di-GMP-specific phosphodiesterase class I)
MHRAALYRLELEEDLRRAIETEELTIHYQPIVALGSGDIVGAEALVRWNHPRRGLVGPAEFIPLAEETGLIRPLGSWVLREACHQARRWHEAWGRLLGISVNVSLRQLEDPGFPDEVSACLQASRLDPRCLTLEITESLLMHDVEATVATLETLKDLGVQLAIDDFGTGYSSLSYLRSLPVDALKIDRSFVREVAESDQRSTVVPAVIKLAGAFGLTTVAEGVESHEQAVELAAQGCDLAQGYYFSRPLEPSAMDALLGSGRTAQTMPPSAAGSTAPVYLEEEVLEQLDLDAVRVAEVDRVLHASVGPQVLDAPLVKEDLDLLEPLRIDREGEVLEGADGLHCRSQVEPRKVEEGEQVFVPDVKEEVGGTLVVAVLEHSSFLSSLASHRDPRSWGCAPAGGPGRSPGCRRHG